jgi:alpha-ketoglutarate-dependent taurine dioxygenase
VSDGLAEKKPLKRLGQLRRQAVSVSAGELVRFDRLRGDRDLPALCAPAVESVDLAAWCRENRALIEQRLLQHGALLFRGFDVHAPESFERVIEAVSGELLEYRERSTPRSQVHHNVYTSTDYPADQAIFPHNENSYQWTFPLKLFFCCQVEPTAGGETPIADCRRVYRRIPPSVRRPFLEKGVMYVRNFGDGLGLSWQSVFQTSDKATVEAYCRSVRMEVEWKAGNRLRVRRVLPATVRHPRTGEEIWFNHGTFFHVTTLPATVRETLLSSFAEEDLPSNTYYGDGSPIEAEVLQELRGIYLDERIIFPWRRGDVLLLDNVLTAHAREPYRGERRILTGMAEPWSRDAT